MSNTSKINSSQFYSEYNGHKVRHLEKLLPPLRESSDFLIWTAGDSSLDNKYWFHDRRPAVGAYREVLDPPTSICDVTYWLNYISATEGNSRHGGRRVAAINTAVEATTLNERTFRLRPQDTFLRDNIKEEDVLMVSIGGNDVALLPCPCTIASIAGLMCLPLYCVENGCSFASFPTDDYCCGCGPSLLSCGCAFPPCLGYFRHLFGTRVQKYIEALTAKTKPKNILICMIYNPDENPIPSWAGRALGALQYNSNPAKLQAFIRKVFQDATSNIRIEGTEVIPVPLFSVLNGKRSEDYVARVEPSAIGGEKMAQYLLDIMNRENHSASLSPAPAAPSTAFISGR
mmetsp:Transcript_6583/g.10014  ORF Transcript_6583/g.10014 Transcript_6583/m.10014 type:complete len:344 (-) Transcript_6583:26-1057(-)